jgi:hypothetical protein
MEVECDGYNISFSGSTLRVSDPWTFCRMELDAETCRQLAMALLQSAEDQVLRQVINDWIFSKPDSLLRKLPVDVLMGVYRGDLVDTNIDTSAFIKEIDARLSKGEAGSANPAA